MLGWSVFYLYSVPVNPRVCFSGVPNSSRLVMAVGVWGSRVAGKGALTCASGTAMQMRGAGIEGLRGTKIIYLEVGGEGTWPQGIRRSAVNFTGGRAYMSFRRQELEIMKQRKKDLFRTERKGLSRKLGTLCCPSSSVPTPLPCHPVPNAFSTQINRVYFPPVSHRDHRRTRAVFILFP